jgi:tRNA (cytidine32/uridine32-2'-O)-methyltransferase
MKDERLSRIRIIIVEPTAPGNIGSIARAMTNFGFEDLVLVNPRPFSLEQAALFACNGKDIISSLKTVSTFREAVSGISTIVGMTRRVRSSEAAVPVGKISDMVIHAASSEKVALVFGRERNGLTKEEKKQCTLLSYIDSVKGPKGSLNLSHATLLAMHEIFRATVRNQAAGAGSKTLFAAFDRFCSRQDGYEPDGKIQNIFRSAVTRAMLNEDEVKKLTRFFGKCSARFK